DATACPGSAVSGSVSEGSELFFLAEITEAQSSGTDVVATVSGDFLASGQAGERTIPILSNMTQSAVFTVRTESADFIDEDDGTVTVSIANPDTSSFILANDEVTVDVTDAPFIDFCRVAGSSATSCPDSALTGSIPENGGEAHFLVFLSTERTEDTEVVITAGGDISRLADTAGSGSGGNQTYTATIRANQTRETITMRAFDNAVPDTPANAEIQVGFTQYSPPSGSGYLLNPDKVVSHPGTNGLFFNIIDNEAPPLPVITLCRIAPIGGTECPHTPVTDTIVEGQPAFFLFEISEAQSSGTDITVTVAETSGSFLAGGQAGARTITIPANMTASGIFSVETQNDRNIGGNGGFTVTSANPDEARFTLAGAQHTVSVSNNDRMATATGVGGEQSVQIEIYDLPSTHGVTAMAFDPETTGGRPHAYTVPSAEETVFTHVVEIDIMPEPDPTAMFELCFPMPPLTDGQDPVIYYGGETGSTWMLQDSYTNEETVCTMTNTASFWAVGAAENSAVDEANKMILPRIAMAVAAETAGMIQDRIKDVFSGGGDSGVSVKGRNLQELIISGAQSGEVPELQLSDFAFSLAANDSYGGGWGAVPGRMLGNISVWGRGYLLHMEDVGGRVEFDGTVTGGMAGVDTLFLPNLLAGVSGNLFTSEIDFRRSATTGTHETTAWSVHPYIGWQPSPRTTIWATGGYGMGSLEAARDGVVCNEDRSSTCRKSDAMIITFGGGASGRMLDRRTAGGGRVVIDAIGDVVYARFIEDGDGGGNVDAGSARFGFELTGSRPAWWGSSLGGDLELAYRGDFGDDVKGSGLEAVGSVKFGVPRWGLRIDLGGRALISHSDNLRERGLSGDIMWSRSFDGTGPFLSFNPQWGATRSKSDTIWEHGVSEVEVETGAGRRYNMEAGYGVPLPYESGLMKVFARSEIVDGAV
ncbi:MAG: autotransporter outer membrane beta-barrel domain-containing protein, partial [Candidatus Dadabacteria bacterium]|nr:autotransporter outer membrane beta-barrel domain-containing protein [Candidatus Dadabacteria bacterium]